MRTALISYHRNAEKLYAPEWISEYKNSILRQTRTDFDIVELNYGGDNFRVFEDSDFHSREFPSFVYALNYLLDCLFFMRYDCVANSNLDDVYSLDRMAKQVPYIAAGYDIVANNFSLVKDGQVIKRHAFDKLNLELELANNHNIVSHPSICYSRGFWDRHRYVPEQQPIEDLMLWQRAIKDSRFIILPDILLYHRLHSNSVCENSENR